MDIETAITNSSCYGIAYDSSCRECRICEVYKTCRDACKRNGGVKVQVVELPPEMIDGFEEVTPTDETDIQEPTTSPTRPADELMEGYEEVVVKPDTITVADPEEVSMSDESMELVHEKAKNGKGKKVVSKKTAKATVTYADDMPNFKKMDVSELEALLEERGVEAAPLKERYGANIPILKMRLIMNLKKTYEVHAKVTEE